MGGSKTRRGKGLFNKRLRALGTFAAVRQYTNERTARVMSATSVGGSTRRGKGLFNKRILSLQSTRDRCATKGTQVLSV